MNLKSEFGNESGMQTIDKYMSKIRLVEAVFFGVRVSQNYC